ncbi:hypothetical protein PHYSODRAFT_492573 [Phytophthora sojae]|uniref:C3H1-type domain-containing protein n=1 Tax=Phytophthora sojae (strain P6497) TaxID=1094619 RepID=G4Z4R8_PHYSP|nr:hypothetical protein PHYSODRAFT_492573 [Phytophthora sojae]EGZ21605.1 hypothetical protein PHYSODRAFT_492573 [Phytophthora sojae]|eukprot:XP_009524322.1 hypothetical protein PHYSODRAFT_492573 [Phytophthora sojae]
MTDINENETNSTSAHFVFAEPDTKQKVEQAERGAGVATAVQSEQTPKRRCRQRLCRFSASGACTKGDKCKFAHEKRPKKSKKRSGDEEAPGGLVLGADATTDSQKAKPAKQPDPSKSAAAPRQNKRQTRARKCKRFARNKCRDGDKCKFSHKIKGVDKVEPRRAVVVQLGASTESANMVTNADNDEWSDAQQRALDQALKKYPASTEKEERWTSIANAVDGRTLNECIDRFQLLCDLVQRGVDVTTSVTANSSESEKGPALDSRIIAPEERITIETKPELKGTQISLEDLFLHKVGTLVAHRLVCQVQCDNCPLTFDAILSLDSAEIQKWCPRCSVLHYVRMRPVFAHSQGDVLAYVDTENCWIADVLPSDMLSTCLKCGCEALLESVAPGHRSEQACFDCHAKLAVMARRFLARDLNGSNRKRSEPLDGVVESKRGRKQAVQGFVLGQPLPRNGACDHYRHSLRWFRFQCCGKAFPCDVCHDLSDCPEANQGKLASRMICGLCSKEQSSAVKVCACGNDVASKRSTTHHWEGGNGCRNHTLMSRWDKQKHRGQNKTESTKLYRVGAEAKKHREGANADADATVGIRFLKPIPGGARQRLRHRSKRVEIV